MELMSKTIKMELPFWSSFVFFMLLIFIQSAYVFEMSEYGGSLGCFCSANTMVNKNSSRLHPHIYSYGKPDRYISLLPLDDCK